MYRGGGGILVVSLWRRTNGSHFIRGPQWSCQRSEYDWQTYVDRRKIFPKATVTITSAQLSGRPAGDCAMPFQLGHIKMKSSVGVEESNMRTWPESARSIHKAKRSGSVYSPWKNPRRGLNTVLPVAC